ncbi:MAG: GGDEF domain-containing protein [Ferrimicrobium sp.]
MTSTTTMRGLARLSSHAEESLGAMLDELRSSTSAMGAILALRLGESYRVERVRATPAVFHENDHLQLTNAVILDRSSTTSVTRPGRIDSEIISFAPLQSVLVAPFDVDQSLVLIIFANHQITLANSIILSLAHGIEHLVIMAQRYERLTGTLQSRLSELDEQASCDPLTQVLNRRGFLETIAREESRVRRNPAPVSLLMFDLDGLKSINDRLGHERGDAHLSHFADLLRQNLRVMDIIGRLGGDEFAVLTPETDEHQAIELANRIHRTLDRNHVPASIGVASLRENDLSLDVLLPRADEAMYRDKTARRAAYHQQLSLY